MSVPKHHEKRSRDTWADAADLEKGGVSANDTARPRDPEAVEGEEKVVTGFTHTSSSGSTGGRALYGLDPEEEPSATDDEAEEG